MFCSPICCEASVSTFKFSKWFSVYKISLCIHSSLYLTGHLSDLWPYVRAQALEENPQLGCMDDLRRVADLRQPPNWYPEARALVRKVVFHAGNNLEELLSIYSSKKGSYWGSYALTSTRDTKHKAQSTSSMRSLAGIALFAGPTNSGKTYSALQSFLRAESGIYCGPLKLLASEVFHKANAAVRDGTLLVLLCTRIECWVTDE